MTRPAVSAVRLPRRCTTDDLSNDNDPIHHAGRRGASRDAGRNGFRFVHHWSYAAAVSEAGGLGSVSVADLWAAPAKAEKVFRGQMDLVASATTKPFAANIPIGIDHTGEVLESSKNHLDYVLDPRRSDASLAAQLCAVATSGRPPDAFTSIIKEAGLIHLHKVGSTRQALRAQRAGVDVVIASGFEMGGHTHTKPVHTFVLAANVSEAVSIPILVSGGVADGRGLLLHSHSVSTGSPWVPALS